MEIILYFIFCYFLGQVMTALIVSKLIFHRDIRMEGSRNVGARNAGRLYGKKAFILSAVGDGLKALIAVLLARLLFDNLVVETTAMTLVIIGHIFPILLKGKGGMGIASYIGGITMLSPTSLLLFLVVMGILLIISRSFTISALFGILTIPFIFLYLTTNMIAFIILLFITLVVFIKHWGNIQERFRRGG